MPETHNLSIKIAPRSGGRYKSISELAWTDIPGLAVLTGRNGSGKTQLLELLAYHLSGALPPSTPAGQILPVEVVLDGTQYEPEEIAFVPNSGRFSGGSSVSLANMPQAQVIPPTEVSILDNYELNLRDTESRTKFELSIYLPGNKRYCS